MSLHYVIIGHKYITLELIANVLREISPCN